MSYCVTGTCPHRRGVFVWLPGGGPLYPWVHDTAAPGSAGRLEVCGLMEPATAAEAGETCGSCGHAKGLGGHEWPKGRFTGEYPSPIACACGCGRWADPPPPPGATVRAAGREAA